jgi:hypothetical protein
VFLTFLTLTLSFGLCILDIPNPNPVLWTLLSSLSWTIIIYRLSIDSVELGLVSDDEFNINVKISLLRPYSMSSFLCSDLFQCSCQDFSAQTLFNVKISLLSINVKISLPRPYSMSSFLCSDLFQCSCQDFSAQTLFNVKISLLSINVKISLPRPYSMSSFLCSDLIQRSCQDFSAQPSFNVNVKISLLRLISYRYFRSTLLLSYVYVVYPHT